MSAMKRLLRNARECLGRREYRDALQHCKEALAEDKSCYEAYIYVGKAAFHLQEHAQAEAAYRRAADLDSRNPLAWQGLAELFMETGRLSADAADIEARVGARLAAEAEALAPGVTPEQAAALESTVRGAVEGEWAEEALELDADHASSTLRRIITLRPPTPPYVPYYDAFLKRLRKYIQAAPPGSMERHSRRAVLLAAAKATMEGRCGTRTVSFYRLLLGLHSQYWSNLVNAAARPAANFISAHDPSLDAASLSPPLETPPLPLLVADCGRIASHLAHSFPWSATAQLHTALSLRRRAAVYGFDAAANGCAVARLPPAAPTAAAGAAGAAAVAPATTSAGGGRRKQVTGMLLSALCRGARGVSGWLAGCELLLEEGAAEAALDASKEGLKYVAHRDLVGKERLAGAALLLRLLAGLALLRLRKLEEAQLLLEGLAHGVSEGHVASGELAGIPPVNICQQGKRLLAHVAVARGDVAGARHRYEELVGGQLMGRSAAPLEAWVHGELGMILLRQGPAVVEGARFHLQSALAALQPALDAAAAAAASPAATALLQLQQEAATYQLHLALALGIKGGGRLQSDDGTDAASGTGSGGTDAAAAAAAAAATAGPSLEPYRSDCRELLLSAAAVPGPLQAAAFTWLGHWYGRASEPSDELKARRCYQRALALDPTQLCEEMRARALAGGGGGGTAAAAGGGGGLCGPASLFLVHPRLLPAVAAATSATAAAAAAGSGGAGWALRSLARLQRDGGSNEAAVANYQAAIRLEPADSELWEGLAAAYQALDRHTAALKVGGVEGLQEGGVEGLEAWLAGGGEVVEDEWLAEGGGGGGGGGEGAVGDAQDVMAAATAASEGGRRAGTALGGQRGYVAGQGEGEEGGNEKGEGLEGGNGGRGDGKQPLPVTRGPPPPPRMCRTPPPGESPPLNTVREPSGTARWDVVLNEIQSYGRALELSPGRLFSRMQAAALHYQMGDMPAALSYYRKALAAAPGNAAGLLGCGEVLLAQAALAARMGAAAAAAAELAEAAELAARATAQYGNLQAGLAAARDRLSQLRLARRAYAAAVHLDPRVAGLWGDLGMSYHLQLELEGQHPGLAADAQTSGLRASSHRGPPRALALDLARGGLRIDPTSDWLWSCSGTIAAAAAADSPAMAAVAEYCYSRALQLNPRRAPMWAALGRLYAAHGEGGLASRCFDAARSHEPTSIAVWEAMGDAALRRAAATAGGGGGGSLAGGVTTAAWRDAADAYEHAQLLGGDVESRLGFVLGSLVTRDRGKYGAAAAAAAPAAPAADSGTVLAAATKAVAAHPLLASAHYSRGLALEARGDYASAVQALETALVLLDECSGESLNQQQRSESCSAPSILPFDPRVAPTVRVAVQLDLARVLAAAGSSKEAIALYDTLRQQGAVRPDDFGAALSYAAALQQAGRSSEALSHLIAVLSNAAVPPQLRVVAATAAVRIHIASRRWDEAYGIVLTVLADLPEEGPVVAAASTGGESAAEAAAKLWRVLLAGLVTAGAPELEAQMLTAMRQWTSGRGDLDTAKHECRVHELLSAKHRAAGAATAALRQAARAVRACPYDRAAWALLSHTAVQAFGPRHAVLAARAAPRDKARHAAAVADENEAPSLTAPPGAAPLTPSAAAAHAAGVTAAAAAAAAAAKGSAGATGTMLMPALREAAARMRRVVHAQPYETSAWYLCALTELQHAIASGGQVRLYRSAAVAARAAATKAKTDLAALPTEPPPATAAAAPPPSPGLRPPPGLPPVLALAMSAQAVSAGCSCNCGATTAAAAAAAGADVPPYGVALVRLPRRRSGETGGRPVAMVMMAVFLVLVPMARLHVATGDMQLANAAYDQACRAAAAAAASSSSSRCSSGAVPSYELLPALEWAAVRAAAGDTAGAATQLLSAARSGGDDGAAAATAVPSRPATALADVAFVQWMLVMLQLGEVEAARAAAAEAAAGGPAAVWRRQPSPGLRSAAYAVQAAAALVQAALVQAATAAGTEDTTTASAAVRKKHLLEARWAAREALKPLSLERPAGQLGHRRSAPPPGPSGPAAALAAALLGWAESGLGKEEAARELQAQAMGVCGRVGQHGGRSSGAVNCSGAVAV
ncbi:hypothetical protein VOLCADRAFT_91745 [Volvox carteri f. nagariensis]|uniref:Uncharacterized protein n=1 Tax=Volvox carteri f. nagariensis TaxID=3068 RepID=D8TXV1_VOLCA|nr:uncharacterized protein VOLCADRAFT_91745 [Volvox carteri f. nagariensis]EFJ47709.1 hypothetical protein VOLCADRAFT_91745 [Volvox carteri f. nagariensis]|eukprot:XP_002951180.1 hypothetical protein VOLCADRAFT_91745 [Volvox carteri f. nagariensis]